VSFQDVSEVSIGPFFEKDPKGFRNVSYRKKRNVKSTVDLLALKIFDSVQEWTFLDPDWLAASSHIILYPFMIRIPVRSRANLMDFAPLFFPYLQSFVSCGELFITKLHP